MRVRLFTIVFLVSVFVACKKTESVRSSNLPASSSIDVSYGAESAQKMDVYLPAGRTAASTKLMLLIHGGGWTSGDKADFNGYIPRLQAGLPDYAFFNINYHLFDGTANRFPTQENDIKAAVDFILGKSDEYAVSKRIVLMGASAGAHLALLQAYKYVSHVRAKAAVSFFGPTDLLEFYNNPPSPAVQPSLVALLGYSPSQNVSIYQQSSPAFFVSNQSIPTILFHGSLDPLVPVSQSILLKNKLDANGVSNKLVIYPNEGHGWIGVSLDDSFKQIGDFLSANVK